MSVKRTSSYDLVNDFVQPGSKKKHRVESAAGSQNRTIQTLASGSMDQLALLWAAFQQEPSLPPSGGNLFDASIQGVEVALNSLPSDLETSQSGASLPSIHIAASSPLSTDDGSGATQQSAQSSLPAFPPFNDIGSGSDLSNASIQGVKIALNSLPSDLETNQSGASLPSIHIAADSTPSGDNGTGATQHSTQSGVSSSQTGQTGVCLHLTPLNRNRGQLAPIIEEEEPSEAESNVSSSQTGQTRVYLKPLSRNTGQLAANIEEAELNEAIRLSLKAFEEEDACDDPDSGSSSSSSVQRKNDLETLELISCLEKGPISLPSTQNGVALAFKTRTKEADLPSLATESLVTVGPKAPVKKVKSIKPDFGLSAKKKKGSSLLDLNSLGADYQEMVFWASKNFNQLTLQDKLRCVNETVINPPSIGLYEPIGSDDLKAFKANMFPPDAASLSDPWIVELPLSNGMYRTAQIESLVRDQTSSSPYFDAYAALIFPQANPIKKEFFDFRRIKIRGVEYRGQFMGEIGPFKCFKCVKSDSSNPVMIKVFNIKDFSGINKNDREERLNWLMARKLHFYDFVDSIGIEQPKIYNDCEVGEDGCILEEYTTPFGSSVPWKNKQALSEQERGHLFFLCKVLNEAVMTNGAYFDLDPENFGIDDKGGLRYYGLTAFTKEENASFWTNKDKVKTALAKWIGGNKAAKEFMISKFSDLVNAEDASPVQAQELSRLIKLINSL